MGHDGLKRTSHAREVLLVTANFVFDQVSDGQCTVAIVDALSNKTQMELTSQYNASRLVTFQFTVNLSITLLRKIKGETT